MPIHHNGQSPLNYEAIMGAGDPVRELARAKCQIAVRLEGGVWQINNWRTGGLWENLPDQNQYIPTICVRGFTLIKGTDGWATLVYNAPGYGPNWQTADMYQIAIANTLRTGYLYTKQITRLWLSDPSTDFTYIYMDG